MGRGELDLIARLAADGHLAGFPNLPSSGFQWTSPYNHTYNCLAWVLGWTHCRMDSHLPVVGDWWPKVVPRSDSIEALVAAYATQRFALCPDEFYEPGFVKIALFASTAGEWTHAARLLDDGRWTTKLGDYDDIAHAKHGDVEGPLYGTAQRYMRRAL